MKTVDQKRRLRQEVHLWRRTFSPEQKKRQERDILHRVLALSSWKGSETIFVYHATTQEIATQGIIRAGLEAGKRIALPRCNYQTRELEFYRWQGEPLLAAPLGIYEPDPDRCPRVLPEEEGLCVTPALAADLEGYRLGYGGGWYDRFLAEYRGTAAVLMWDRWLLEAVPAEPHDRPADLIVTETRTLCTARGKGAAPDEL